MIDTNPSQMAAGTDNAEMVWEADKKAERSEVIKGLYENTLSTRFDDELASEKAQDILNKRGLDKSIDLQVK